MRSKIILSGFIACLLSGTSLMAEENALPVPQDLQQQVTNGVSTAKTAVTSTVDALPPLPGTTPPAPLNEAAKKAEAASVSAPPPVQLAPLPAVPAAATTAAVPAAPVTPATTAPAATTAATTAPAAPVPAATPAGNTALTLPPVAGTLPVPELPGSIPAPAQPLAIMNAPAKNLDLPPALPADPSMLPSPNNSAASTPALPFGVPDAAKQAETPAATEPAKILTSEGTATATGAATTEAPKKVATHGKHRKQVAANGKVHYRNIRLPATIYKKHYEPRNKDLPTAYYETDLDRLLFIAVKSDNLNGVRGMLDYSKRNINKPNARGETPLMVAASSNAYNVTRLLVGRHADLTARDASGMTALQHAEQSGNGRIANILRSIGGESQMAKQSVAMVGGTPVQLMKPTHLDVN